MSDDEMYWSEEELKMTPEEREARIRDKSDAELLHKTSRILDEHGNLKKDGMKIYDPPLDASEIPPEPGWQPEELTSDGSEYHGG